MNIKCLLAVLMFGLSSICYGQGSIPFSGKVLDTEKKPIVTGDAFLLAKVDSSMVKYAPINMGNFSFNAVQAGEYLLKIVCFGYTEHIQPIVLSRNEELAIILSTNTATLKEVTVSGSKKLFTNKNGNLKVNVENSILAAIPTPIDLLSKLPAIQVSPSGESISILGKGNPLIYIDNQKVSVNDLQSLAVNDIKTIEIINNPSAKYEAAGRAVILITKKTNKQDGIKVDLAETATVRQYYNNRFSLGADFKNKKLALKANFQYNQIKNWEGNAYTFDLPTQNFTTSYDVTSITTRPQFIYGLNLLYDIDSSSYFSVNTSERSQSETFPISTNSYARQGTQEDYVATTNLNSSKRFFSTTSANYTKKFKQQDVDVFVGGQYSVYDRSLESNIWNNYNNTADRLTQDREQDNTIHVFTTRADVEKRFKNEVKWETGINASFSSSNAVLDIQNYIPPGSDLSNYTYSERNMATYTQASGKIKKVDYAVGIRMEATKVEGQFANSSSLLIDKHYINFFPKLNVDFPLDSTKTLNLNYARSINRPDYSSISQTVVYINPYFEWASNISIDPTIVDELSATIQYKNSSLQASCYKQEGPIYSDFVYNTSSSILRRTDKNFKREVGASIALTVPVKYKVWTSTNCITAGISKVEDESSLDRESTPYIYLFSNNQIKLPYDMVWSVNAWGVTKRNEGVYERNGLYAVDTSLSKTFFKKLSCTMSANNIFKSLSSKEQFVINDISSKGTYYDVRDYSVAIKYSFGKSKPSNHNIKNVDEHVNRIN